MAEFKKGAGINTKVCQEQDHKRGCPETARRENSERGQQNNQAIGVKKTPQCALDRFQPLPAVQAPLRYGFGMFPHPLERPCGNCGKAVQHGRNPPRQVGRIGAHKFAEHAAAHFTVSRGQIVQGVTIPRAFGIRTNLGGYGMVVVQIAIIIGITVEPGIVLRASHHALKQRVHRDGPSHFTVPLEDGHSTHRKHGRKGQPCQQAGAPRMGADRP
ncbi:MAG: hypothetical protein BWY09_01607 [Candidatus Hydrogenedentes bacterium ADurb.Bin179]|nr:MAG: hypothetical protein BWY09_01607 [Candidatus Hydrogenedentes bacterium ADurb.Bin179]